MTIASKIAKASVKVGGSLRADKRHEKQNYGYISADKILGVAGQALAEQGIAVIPAIMSASTELIEYTNSYGKGGSRIDATVNFLMKISDGESELDMMWFGMGTDYSTPDKALYKAITSGHKYFLMKLLNIGEGNEDSEHEEQPQIATATRVGTGNSADQDFDNLPTHPDSYHHKTNILDGVEFPGDFETGKAIAWAMKQEMPDGKPVFNANIHAKNSLLKLRKENPSLETAPLKMAWKAKVEDKQTPMPVDDDQLNAGLDAQAHAEEEPKF